MIKLIFQRRNCTNFRRKKLVADFTAKKPVGRNDGIEETILLDARVEIAFVDEHGLDRQVSLA